MAIITEDSITQQFDVGPGAEFSINNVAGAIRIRGTEGSRISVQATKHGKESARDNTEIEMTQDGSRVTVRTRQKESGLLKLTRGLCSVEYEVEVPRDCEVQARSVSADTTVTGTRAGARVDTVSGNIVMEDVAGECGIHSVSGDLTARAVDGPIRLHSTSGDAKILESHVPDFNCHTVSGDLTVETQLVAGEHYLAKTVSGDLHLIVPAGTGATVQMRSVSGDVRTDIPAEIIRAGRRHWQGRINGGGAEVEMNSVSGDMRISVSSRLPGTEPSDSRTEDTTPDVETHRADATAILELLERGEITVEEAMNRLKALR